MGDNMDIDLDLEDEDPEIAQMRAQAQAMNERAKAAEAEFEAMNVVVEQAEEGEVTSSDAIPEKVHIRGLDKLTTADIRAFVKEHYPEDFKRVEWIDDTSANLVFETSAAAADALYALSAEEVADALDLRPAKQMSTHPNTQLELRQAIAADVKLPGAKDRSRFYLMNPEYDPEARASLRKRRYDDDRNGSHKRRRNDDQYNRRGSTEGAAFSEDFYDDAVKAPAASRHLSHVQKKRSQMEDLFANRNSSDLTKGSLRKKDGRLRERSASPVRDGNGKYGFDEEQPYRRTARQRTATPPHMRKARKREYGAEDANRDKELFPDKSTAAHKRSHAQDLHPDYVADVIEPKSNMEKRDLFDRIGSGRKDHGRLNGSDLGNGSREGFSILGAARDRVENPLVKELFPLKSSAQKKDLFDGRIKGRANQRRRAEDLF